MGNNSTLLEYATPPLSFNADLGGWSFIQEPARWPVTHMVIPFTLYIYTRDFLLVSFLCLCNEIAEVLIGLIFNEDPSQDFAMETIGKALISDIFTGWFGIWMIELFMQCCQWNYVMLPTSLYRNYKWIGRILKYYFQIIVMVLPYTVINLMYANGLFSIGLTIGIAWYPFFLYIWYLWNKNDPLWINKLEPVSTEEDGSLLLINTYIAKETQIQRQRQVSRFYFFWGIFTLIFSVSFFYLYTYPFIEAFGHAIIIIIVLYIVRQSKTYRYFYVDRNPNYHLAPSKRKKINQTKKNKEKQEQKERHVINRRF